MVKSRSWSKATKLGAYATQPENPGPSTTSFENSVMYAGDEGHYGWPDFPTDRNIGGRLFLNSRSGYSNFADAGTIRTGSSRYTGMFAGTWPPISALPGTSWTPDSSDASDAYNRMKPAQPNFQALNAIYELRELPRMLQQRLSHNNLKDIGNYYLALKFGWEPLLRDIRNFVITQRNAQDRLAQLLRDNGKPVRRSIVLHDDSSTVYTSGNSYGALMPTLITGFYQGVTPSWRSSTISGEKIWASARFRYWLPGGPRGVIWRRRMLARIFGLRPSPKVVWDALPWTWLADWFVDVGSMLENLDTGVADRLAADYCWIMRHKYVVGTRETTGFFRHAAGDYFNLSASGSSTASLKCRDLGSPFGWNVNEASLSSHQLGILGALGLSRLPK
jgi:hypothetical protein